MAVRDGGERVLLVRRRQDGPVGELLPHGIDEGRLEARRGDGVFLWHVRTVAADEDVFLRVDGVGVVEARRVRVRKSAGSALRALRLRR